MYYWHKDLRLYRVSTYLTIIPNPSAQPQYNTDILQILTLTVFYVTFHLTQSKLMPERHRSSTKHLDSFHTRGETNYWVTKAKYNGTFGR